MHTLNKTKKLKFENSKKPIFNKIFKTSFRGDRGTQITYIGKLPKILPIVKFQKPSHFERAQSRLSKVKFAASKEAQKIVNKSEIKLPMYGIWGLFCGTKGAAFHEENGIYSRRVGNLPI